MGKRTVVWHPLFWSLVVWVCLAWTACSQPYRDDVLVVERTKTYHTYSCPRVIMAEARMMKRDQAKAENCKACPACKPDSVAISQQQIRGLKP